MSSSHTRMACLMFSFFLHWQILGFQWTQALPPANGREAVVPESRGDSQHRETSFALHQMLEQVGPGNPGADCQTQMIAQYLKQIKQQINLNKFSGLDPDASQIIGNARYSFSIDENGRFISLVLVKSSGNPLLDKAARIAVGIACHKVKRPGSTGTAPIPLKVTVKYQYGL